MSNTVKITDLDTDNTLLYKYAHKYDTITRFVIVEKPESIPIYDDKDVPTVSSTLEKYTYESLEKIVTNMSREGKSLIDVQEKYGFPFKGQVAMDIQYIYFKNLLEPIRVDLYNFLTDPKLINYNKKYKGKVFSTKKDIKSTTNIDDIIGVFNQVVPDKAIDLTPFINKINEIRKYNGIEELSDFIPFTDEYKTWIIEYNRTKKKETAKLMMIDENIKSISERIDINDIISTPVNYTHFVRAGKIMMQENGGYREPESRDGIYMFNKLARVSPEVPFIVYNSDNVKSYKIYTKKKGEESKDGSNNIDYKNIIPSSSRTKDNNTIYMIVWTGVGDPNNAKKESRMLISYNLDLNKIVISSRVRKYTEDGQTMTEDKLIIERVEKAFQNKIKINYSEELSVGANFDLYGIPYNEESFVFFLMINSLINSYLYIDETTNAYPFKKRLYYHFKSIIGLEDENDKNTSTAWISLKQHPISDDQRTIINGIESAVKTQKYDNYMRISLVRAQSRTIVNQLHYLLPRLLKLYKLYQKPFLNDLVVISPIMRNLFVMRIEEEKKKEKAMSKIAQMSKQAPDLIIKYYARTCQCNQQPIIINSEDIPAWQSKQVIISGAAYPRQIMPFPPNEPKWYFVCPGDVWPFPGVKESKLENSDKYPFVPCCFKKDQMSKTANSKYNEVYLGIQRKKGTAKQKNKHFFRTDKKLNRGRTGQLPGMIETLLQMFYPNDNFVRNGAVHSTNSLLHCIYEAFKEPNYLSLPTDEMKEDYIKQVRSLVVQSIYKEGEYDYTSLLKQELHDFTKDEIIRQLSNNESFYDPALYYRAVEEFMNINIFVFTAPSTTLGGFGKIEVPRHKLFHARSLRKDRPTIIIFKHWGSDSDKLKYPQCEFVSRIDTGSNQTISLFDTVPEAPNKMSEFLHNSFVETNKTVMWSLDPRNYRPIARSNVFSSFNILEILSPYKANITKQYVDNYGKMRGLLIYAGNQNISIFIPPSQPEKYIEISTELPKESNPTLTTVLALFGIQPTAITKNDEFITGLWFPILDIEEGIYCPILANLRIDQLPEDLTFLTKLPIGSTHNFFASGINHVRRYKTLIRHRRIILELTKWIYVLYKYNNPSGSLDNFINQYIQSNSQSSSPIDYSTTDSTKIYNFSSLSHILPDKIKTVSDAITYLTSFTPDLNLVRNNKITGYSQRFTDGILYFLKDYDYSTDKLPIYPYTSNKITDESIVIPREISGMYHDEYDYDYNDNTLIFIGESSMKSWLYSLIHLGVEVSEIKKTLDISYGIYQYPYLYQSPDKQIYMIQNVQNGDLYRALNVANSWYLNSKNTGFSSPPYDLQKENSIPPYFVYGVSTSGELTPIFDQTNGNPIFLKIISYIDSSSSVQQYGAILPML